MFQRVAAICTLIVGLVTFSISADAAKTTARLLTSDSAPMVRLPGHVLPALARATVIRPSEGTRISEANQSLTLTMVFKRDDPAAFDRYLHDVYDSRSPIFRHFLTQSEISDRFGPTPESVREGLGLSAQQWIYAGRAIGKPANSHGEGHAHAGRAHLQLTAPRLPNREAKLLRQRSGSWPAPRTGFSRAICGWFGESGEAEEWNH
jgi:hypothetical protein